MFVRQAARRPEKSIVKKNSKIKGEVMNKF
jgi:hypothetical protein